MCLRPWCREPIINCSLTLPSLFQKKSCLECILDCGKGLLKEDGKGVYEELKKQDKLHLEEYKLCAISNTFQLKLRKNVLARLQSRETPVNKMLEFPYKEEPQDTAEILRENCGKKIGELDDCIKDRLKFYIGLTIPGMKSQWKILCQEYLDFSSRVIIEIKTHSGSYDMNSPADQLLNIMATKIPELILNEFYKHLTSARL